MRDNRRLTVGTIRVINELRGVKLILFSFFGSISFSPK